MESIIQELSDPGKWVSGILFSLIATVIYKVCGSAPAKIRHANRARKLKSLKKLRSERSNPAAISYAIARANSHYIAFLLMCFFYLASLLMSEELSKIVNKSFVLGLVIGLPIFILEIFWLYHDLNAKALVDAHGKLLAYRNRH